MAEIIYKHFTGPKYEHDDKAGLSRFTLATMENDDNYIQLNGLLTEIPEISFSVNYNDGPGNEWQDILSKFMANDLVSIFNAIGAKGGGFKNLLKVGTWTKQVYAGYSPSTIPLKFRIYTEDTLGQTSPEDWITYLEGYATISGDNEFNLTDAAGNIINVFINAYNTGAAAGEAFDKNVEQLFFERSEVNKMTDENEDTNSEKEYQKKSEQIQNAVKEINKLFATITSLYAEHNEILKLSLDLDDDWHYTRWWNFGTQEIMKVTLKIELSTKTGIWPLYKDDEKVGVYRTTKVGWTDFGKKHKSEVLYLDSNEIIDTLKNFVNEYKNNTEYTATNVTNDAGEWSKIFKEIERICQEGGGMQKKPDDFIKIINAGKETANKLENILLGKYTYNRVREEMNKENALGEKLWHLYLYNDVIFKSTDPLTVYISDWSVKPSAEVINNRPVYYDFEITCAMDQVYSRNTWRKHLVDIKKEEITNINAVDELIS